MSEPVNDTVKLTIQIEDCFVGHNFPNTEIVVKIRKLITSQTKKAVGEVLDRMDKNTFGDKHMLGVIECERNKLEDL